MAMKFPEGIRIRRDEGKGTVTYLKGENLSIFLERDARFVSLQQENRFREIAVAFMAAYRMEFLLQDPVRELKEESVVVDDLGLKHIRFQQVFEAIPLWASALTAHLNRANQVYLVEGRYLPTPSGINTRPALSEAKVLDIVQRALESPGASSNRSQSSLLIFAPEGQNPRLAFHVVAYTTPFQGWSFMVDAQQGIILEKLRTVIDRMIPLN